MQCVSAVFFADCEVCNGFPALFSVMCDVCVVQGVVCSGFPLVLSVQYILWVLCRGPCTAYSVFPAVFNVQCVDTWLLNFISSLCPNMAKISCQLPQPCGLEGGTSPGLLDAGITGIFAAAQLDQSDCP